MTGSEVVPHKTLTVAEPKARALAKQLTPRVPSRAELWRSTKWWSKWARDTIPWLWWLALKELRPVGRGLGKVAAGWARWAQCAELAESVKEAKENERSKAAERLTKRRSARGWGSVVALVAIAVGLLVLYLRAPLGFYAALIVVAAVLDWIGRRAVKPTGEKKLPALPQVLSENVPLRQITASILGTFDREGFEEGSVRVAVPLRWVEAQHEYRISLATADGIKPEHLRAIERGIGARDHSIRSLATGTATVRELVIRIGDPLAALVERPFVPTGSRSIAQTVSLGASMTDQPFAIPFAGVHIRIVAGTGGGKTKWVLRSAIDGLSACRDCVIGGIDITNGPEMTLWRGVIQHRGLNVEDAERVLDLALAEIDRRSTILTEIAEDDDPDNDADEWHAGLGPAFVVFVDEFSALALFDGKGGKPNLLGKCEQIVRTGRKHWVSLAMFTQRTGNDDFGSTTMSTLCAVSIAGPCDASDAVRMFGVERRDAGYTPHLLSPGVEGDIRDAGKVFIDSPMHRTPDIYRAYAPGTTSEVKRRARQRIEDGLPTLSGRREPDAVDAVEVPQILAGVELAFHNAGNPDRLATFDLLARLGDVGFELDENRLAAQLRKSCSLRSSESRWTPTGGGNPVRGYLLADVRSAIRELS